MTTNADPLVITTEEIRSKLRLAAGNVRRTGDATLWDAGLMLLADQMLGELLDERAALLRSVKAASAPPLPAGDDADAEPAPAKKRRGRKPAAAADAPPVDTRTLPLAEFSRGPA